VTKDFETRQSRRCSQLDVMLRIFGDRVISKDVRLTRSADLTPPDFFVWDLLMGRFTQTNLTPSITLNKTFNQDTASGMLQRI
jgi:hypothetical protein